MTETLRRTAPAALRCEGLVHVYREADTDVAALRGIDLVVEEGQRIALLGPSGSGKSTLMAIVAGILRPSAGRVVVFGTDIGRAKERELAHVRRSTLGLMLQGASTNLLLHEDSDANLAWALRGAERGDVRLGRRVLRSSDLHRDRRPVSAMSPSEQQIVALAVAMAGRPRLLVADEPTSQLDDASRDHLLDVLVETASAEGTATLIVTHDEQVAARMQRMIHLRDGRIGEEASDRGRFAVVGADGSVQLPAELRDRWPAGSFVSVAETAPGELVLNLQRDEVTP
ncbi:ABC-type lipoprotein export system ATPase subunit [Frondihabitans sp. PhB188]|uniref:ABC transporter ATP-binding protein n=1 Tax=Frondihabitans sp. PhB188 TaxID=2485200 RepID=UPI000F467DC5|nr:ATP-binding cassette domain-containing protein [Frondihabitans sp. PhB188]ROQ39740.1 ABC-type lipoprotein export system ATPase subunit [Frondihabitans sp. PhB188]